MRYLILSAMCLIVSCMSVADEPKSRPPGSMGAIASTFEAFSGTWKIAAGTPEAATRGARRLVFNEDGTYVAQDREGKELWAGTFEIDPSATPKVWDHRSNDARSQRKDVLGIYVLNGDNLKVACVLGQWEGKQWVGRPRPRAIDLREADVVIELKRLKSGN